MSDKTSQTHAAAHIGNLVKPSDQWSTGGFPPTEAMRGTLVTLLQEARNKVMVNEEFAKFVADNQIDLNIDPWTTTKTKAEVSDIMNLLLRGLGYPTVEAPSAKMPEAVAAIAGDKK